MIPSSQVFVITINFLRRIAFQFTGLLMTVVLLTISAHSSAGFNIHLLNSSSNILLILRLSNVLTFFPLETPGWFRCFVTSS